MLAKELGPRKITIAPGGVETEGVHRIGIIGSEFEKEMVSNTPLGRFWAAGGYRAGRGVPGSEDAGWVTGERIAVSGGYR